MVRWSGKILQIHNIKSIKDFIIDYFDKSNPELFYKDNPYSVKYEEDDSNLNIYKFCPKCGNNNSDSYKFCVKCGNNLQY